jgi:peptidoglycan/xylan/chitin deacetylase (PgdA/CDA1 family)
MMRRGLGMAGRLLRRSLRMARPFVAGEIPVLTYHSVDDTRSLLSISPNELRTQLAYLHSKGWSTLSPAEYVAQSAMPPDQRPGRLMLITFDDGYRNFHEQAVPLLLEFGYTATLFVGTGFVGRQPSWLDRDGFISQLLNEIGLTNVQRHELDNGISVLARETLLGWPQLREIVSVGMHVQSHSSNHAMLTRLRPSELRQDLRESRLRLEDELGASVTSIAYPYGICNERVALTAREVGFEVGFIADHGARDKSGMMTWRVGISGSNAPAEVLSVLQTWPLYPRLRNLIRRRDALS